MKTIKELSKTEIEIDESRIECEPLLDAPWGLIASMAGSLQRIVEALEKIAKQMPNV